MLNIALMARNKFTINFGIGTTQQFASVLEPTSVAM